MKIALEAIEKGISASQMAAIARSGCVFHEPWMRDYVNLKHQNAFWEQVQRVTQQLPEAGSTVASWLAQLARDELRVGEVVTPELYAEAGDYILKSYRYGYVPSYLGWSDSQYKKKMAKRRARLADLAPEDFRTEWDGMRPLGPGQHSWYDRPADREELIQLATSEQLATLTPADLGPLLASGDPDVRTAALRTLGKVSRERMAA